MTDGQIHTPSECAVISFYCSKKEFIFDHSFLFKADRKIRLTINGKRIRSCSQLYASYPAYTCFDAKFARRCCKTCQQNRSPCRYCLVFYLYFPFADPPILYGLSINSTLLFTEIKQNANAVPSRFVNISTGQMTAQ